MVKLKEILRRKVDFISRSFYQKGFYSLVTEFYLFICQTPELVPIMKKILGEDRISRDFLFDILMSSTVHFSVRNEINIPEFYTKEMEAKYNIYRNLMKSAKEEFEASKSEKRTDTQELENFPNAQERREMRFNIVKLYHSIVEDLDLSELRAKEAKSKTQEPSMPYFQKLDQKRGILYFGGMAIEIAKKGKETYPLQLVLTLIKEPERFWFEDEILEDWGYTEEEIARLPKNRVYHAALKVNDLITKKTHEVDFIEHTTEKFRINPKFLLKNL